MIELTEKAVKRAILMAERQSIPKILRLGVRGGGCSGLSYVIDFVEDSTPKDQMFEYGELRVVVDPKSAKLLNETVLDYESNLLNGGFKFKNPRARKSCSCGESFTIV